MSKRLLVVNGHPDPRPERYCAALADSFAAGARASGWQVERLDVGALPLPLPGHDNALSGHDSERFIQALHQIHAADRLVVIFPLWLDGPPGRLRELFEHYASFAWKNAPLAAADAAGKPAEAIVTMDMPAFIQRAKLREQGYRARLTLPGIKLSEPVFIGSLQSMSAAQRQDWLEKARLRGAHGD